MYRYLVSALFALASAGIVSIASGAAPGAAPGAVSSWWSEGIRAYALASGYAPTRTVILIEELDSAGAVKTYEKGETRIESSGDASRTIVVSAEKDGKDATEEWRKRYEKPQSAGKSEGGPPPGFDATPFDPKYADALTRGAARASGSLVEVPYSIATGGGPVEGVATFSADGAVVSAVQEWMKPPAFVSSMSSTTLYAYHDGALVVSAMKIEGEASILFVKRRFRMSFEFFEWARKNG